MAQQDVTAEQLLRALRPTDLPRLVFPLPAVAGITDEAIRQELRKYSKVKGASFDLQFWEFVIHCNNKIRFTLKTVDDLERLYAIFKPPNPQVPCPKFKNLVSKLTHYRKFFFVKRDKATVAQINDKRYVLHDVSDGSTSSSSESAVRLPISFKFNPPNAILANADDQEFKSMMVGEVRKFELIVTNNTGKDQRCVISIKKQHPDLSSSDCVDKAEIIINKNYPSIFHFEIRATQVGLIDTMVMFSLERLGTRPAYLHVLVDDEITKILSTKEKFAAFTEMLPPATEIIPGEAPSVGSTKKINFGHFRIPSQLRKLNEANSLDKIDFKALHDDWFVCLRNLMWLEEIQMEKDIQLFNQENVYMKPTPSRKYIELDVPGLSEKRPSVLYGDKIYVRETRDSTREYEGFVHEVKQTSVSLVFHKDFMQRYSRVPFPVYVRFTFSRTPLRYCHFGIESGRALKRMQEVLVPERPGTEPFTRQTTINFYNKKLNSQQRQAVTQIIKGTYTPTPYIVFGPPGTGKTVTIVESILQLYKYYPNSRILACAPSNNASDIIVQRLSGFVQKADMFRLHSYQRDPRSIIDSSVSQYSRLNQNTGKFDMPQIQELKKCRIIVTTCIFAARLALEGMPRDYFTHVFIDEAGQATEPEALVPITTLVTPTRARIILSGDPQQLGPVIRSPHAKQHGLAISLLERLSKLPIYARNPEFGYNQDVITKLLHNYRSHKLILETPSRLFYHNELIPSADHVLVNAFVGWKELPSKSIPIIFHSVKGREQQTKSSPSWFNPEEVSKVLEYVTKLRESRNPRVVANDIGVIAPYREQVAKIRQVLKAKGHDEVQVGSVEEFQGQEKRIIIISCVRSSVNQELARSDIIHNIGFLRNPKRFNVAITRAQALLIIIGNPTALWNDPNWKELILFAAINKATFSLNFNDLTKPNGEANPNEEVEEIETLRRDQPWRDARAD